MFGDTHSVRMDLVLSLAERWTEAVRANAILGMTEFESDVFDAAIQSLSVAPGNGS